MSWMALVASTAAAGLIGYMAGMLVSTRSNQNHIDELAAALLHALEPVANGIYGAHTGDDSLPEQIRRRLDGGDGA